MNVWFAAFYGALGGFMIDGLEFVRAVRANHHRIPVRFKRPGYLLGEAVRLAIGAALAAVYYASGQATGPLAAVTVGIAAPMIIERLATHD
jgi:hypothetical protein